MLVHITDLPDAALQRVVELASTPSTPGPCLLSGVSKGFRRASDSAKDGTVIYLQLGRLAATLQKAPAEYLLWPQPPPDPCGWPQCKKGTEHACMWHDEHRLLGLAQWLVKYASQVTLLCITYSNEHMALLYTDDLPLRHRARQAQADAVSAIAASLVAAAAKASCSNSGVDSSGSSSSGGVLPTSSSSSSRGRDTPHLPLQQLRLPAAGGLTSISNTLAVCGGLRKLRLDASLSINDTRLGYQALCKALCGLTQLTALQVADVWTDPDARVEPSITLDPLFSSCPASLEVLLVKVRGWESRGTLCTANLTHLTNLRQLRLEGHGVRVQHEEGVGSQQALAALTLLTCLMTDAGLHEGGCALLDLPQLQVFSTAEGPQPDWLYLEQLVGKTSCRKLVLQAGTGRASNMNALTQLTQLTELVLGSWSMTQVHASAWCAAFAAMSRLECLTIPMGHWCTLSVHAGAMCKRLTQMRRLVLIYADGAPPGAAGMVHHLQQLQALQQLTISGHSSQPARCIAAAAEQALPGVEVLLLVTGVQPGRQCVVADLLE